MEEREGFIKDSKLAIKGALNGFLGSMIYELLIVLLFSIVISSMVSANNPNASSEQLKELVDVAYNSFPFSILISCLTSLVTLVVFVAVLKFDTFKQILKRLFDVKVVKYGFIGSLCIMGFSIFYNSVAQIAFGLEGTGNANQEAVIGLIKSNVFLGFLAVVVLAPIVEELTYRYCMFGGLCKYKKWIAYVVTAVLFMAMHGVSSYTSAGGFNEEFFVELIYLPPYLFSGLALAYAYDKTGNIGTSTLAHAINNFISFLAIVCL